MQDRQRRAGQQGWRDEGFEGDEFVGFDRGRLRAQQQQQQQPAHEYEAFSPDQAWMPNVVLIAKSTYVWAGAALEENISGTSSGWTRFRMESCA